MAGDKITKEPLKRVEKPLTPEERKEEMKENIVALVTVLLIMAGIIVWVYLRLNTPAEEPEQRFSIPIAGSPTLGAAQAPVAIIIFSDFECPFCAQFALETLPAVKEQYVDTGKAIVVFKQFPLDTHRYAAAAAQASLCAEDQGKFWEYHDLLYANPEALTREDLGAYAQQAGIEMARFDSCMERPATQVEEEKLLGKSLGVAGTPTFFINGRKVTGFLAAAEFSAEIEKELLVS